MKKKQVSEIKLEKIYASKRLTNKMIRAHEQTLAHRIFNKEKYALVHPRNSNSIENAFEWFLSWRLKRSDYPDILWCDGAEDINITWQSQRDFSFTAKVRVGSENDVSVINECQAKGTFKLTRNCNGFKSYRISVYDKGYVYRASK